MWVEVAAKEERSRVVLPSDPASSANDPFVLERVRLDDQKLFLANLAETFAEYQDHKKIPIREFLHSGLSHLVQGGLLSEWTLEKVQQNRCLHSVPIHIPPDQPVLKLPTRTQLLRE